MSVCNEQGRLIWITGLPGSGKTTIARKVTEHIKKNQTNVVNIDGDDVRELILNELGYDEHDRKKNAYIIARLCNFLTKQGHTVVCSTVSLYHEIHAYNREHNPIYFEIFLEVDMKELLDRDQRGLYSDAIGGRNLQVVGMNQEYEAPKCPELTINNNFEDDLKPNIKKVLKLINIK